MSETIPCPICDREMSVNQHWCTTCFTQLPLSMNHMLLNVHPKMVKAAQHWEAVVQMCRDYLKAVYEAKP